MVYGTWLELAKTKILVDGFGSKDKEKCQHYVLSHFHSDHTAGLGKGFHHGTIYCTPCTRDLIVNITGVKAQYVEGVPLNTKRWLIPGELWIAFLDANHCPGAAIMFFWSKTHCYLHTGDFRAADCLIKDTKDFMKREGIQKVDTIYLDNTYCRPKWLFPSQDDVLAKIKSMVLAELREAKKYRATSDGDCLQNVSSDGEPDADAEMLATRGEAGEGKVTKRNQGLKIWFFVGSYSIGKEKCADVVAEAVAEALAEGRRGGESESERGRVDSMKKQLFVRNRRRWRIQQEVAKHNPEFGYFRNDNGAEADVWMVPLGEIRHDTLQRMLDLGPSAIANFTEEESRTFAAWRMTNVEGSTSRRREVEALQMALEQSRREEQEAKSKGRSKSHDGDVDAFEERDCFEMMHSEMLQAEVEVLEVSEVGPKAKADPELHISSSSSTNEAAKIAEGQIGVKKGRTRKNAHVVTKNATNAAQEGAAKTRNGPKKRSRTTGKASKSKEDRQGDKVVGVGAEDQEKTVPIPGVSDVAKRVGDGPAAVCDLSFSDSDDSGGASKNPQKRRKVSDGSATEGSGHATASAEATETLKRDGRGDETTESQQGGQQDTEKAKLSAEEATAQENPEERRTNTTRPHEYDPKYDIAIGFRPTGWAYRAQDKTVKPWISNNGRTKIFHVPYSEHSSFDELINFVKAIGPGEVIPTVPTNDSMAKVKSHFLKYTDGSTDVTRIEYWLRQAAMPLEMELVDGEDEKKEDGSGPEAKTENGKQGDMKSCPPREEKTKREDEIVLVDLVSSSEENEETHDGRSEAEEGGEGFEEGQMSEGERTVDFLSSSSEDGESENEKGRIAVGQRRSAGRKQQQVRGRNLKDTDVISIAASDSAASQSSPVAAKVEPGGASAPPAAPAKVSASVASLLPEAPKKPVLPKSCFNPKNHRFKSSLELAHEQRAREESSDLHSEQKNAEKGENGRKQLLRRKSSFSGAGQNGAKNAKTFASSFLDAGQFTKKEGPQFTPNLMQFMRPVRAGEKVAEIVGGKKTDLSGSSQSWWGTKQENPSVAASKEKQTPGITTTDLPSQPNSGLSQTKQDRSAPKHINGTASSREMNEKNENRSDEKILSSSVRPREKQAIIEISDSDDSSHEKEGGMVVEQRTEGVG